LSFYGVSGAAFAECPYGSYLGTGDLSGFCITPTPDLVLQGITPQPEYLTEFREKLDNPVKGRLWTNVSINKAIVNGIDAPVSGQIFANVDNSSAGGIITLRNWRTGDTTPFYPLIPYQHVTKNYWGASLTYKGHEFKVRDGYKYCDASSGDNYATIYIYGDRKILTYMKPALKSGCPLFNLDSTTFEWVVENNTTCNITGTITLSRGSKTPEVELAIPGSKSSTSIQSDTVDTSESFYWRAKGIKCKGMSFNSDAGSSSSCQVSNDEANASLWSPIKVSIQEDEYGYPNRMVIVKRANQACYISLNKF